MIEGLFKATYGTPLGQGVAVVTLIKGVIQGGDPALYYTGRYTEEGGRFEAEFKTARHTQQPGIQSVFGRDNATVRVEGAASTDRVQGKGTSPDAPGLTFSFGLERLPPL